jgi:DinB superfamily
MTDARQVVARQMDRSGAILMLALEPVPDEEFFAENANGFSAAWVTGHLACFADLFSSWFDGLRLFGDDFHSVFNETELTPASTVSKAARVDRGHHAKAALLFRFNQAWNKALDALAASDIAQWDGPPPLGAPVGLLTAGSVWEVAVAPHVYWHLGELAGSMPRFFGTYTLNILPHYFYRPPAVTVASCPDGSRARAQ